VSRLSRKCGSLDVSQPYEPPWLVTGLYIDLTNIKGSSWRSAGLPRKIDMQTGNFKELSPISSHGMHRDWRNTFLTLPDTSRHFPIAQADFRVALILGYTTLSYHSLQSISWGSLLVNNKPRCDNVLPGQDYSTPHGAVINEYAAMVEQWLAGEN
jgi:hypothetical protein